MQQNNMQAKELLQPSQTTPICQHFGICGGCRFQDWAKDKYEEYKLSLLKQKFTEKNINIKIDKLIEGQLHARRRVTFHAHNQNNNFIFGFFKKKSHELFEIKECPISVPAIENNIKILRQIAALFSANKPIDITVIQAENGLDVTISKVQNLTDQKRFQLVKFAEMSDILRITVNQELIIKKENIYIKVNNDLITFPPGVFLQATYVSQQQMIEITIDWLRKQKNIVDLFSGIGTFSLPMSYFSSIDAFDSDENALKSLQIAANNIKGIKKISTSVRDLFKRPLVIKELQPYDGLIIDPPRAGSIEQIVEIAKSNIPKLVVISCNYLTLVRDIEILLKGGYKIEKTIAIDQFLYSEHLEVMILLSKEKKKKKWTL
ncbi:RNA methyltransferase [Bartonella sp. DGB1]|uniref:class I SAM-dependent RNA methyltransferase n=1 Tax=Bartonella sp. DGB1 TaxID=3239807 RepID=UPI00352448C8